MDDIPKSIILVLLFITVLISVLGAWTVLDKMNSVQVGQPLTVKSSDSAIVALTVLDPKEPYPPKINNVDSAQVGITVLEPNGGIENG